MITIVDYGLGNIQAFVNVYQRLNIPVAVASTPDELRKAEKIILPGVGAFDWAITQLTESGLRDVLDRLVREDERPVLGVCVRHADDGRKQRRRFFKRARMDRG